MIVIKNKSEGFVSQYLAFLIVLLMLLVLFFQFITPLQEMGIHNRLMMIDRAALFRCEADGGLSTTTITQINNDLQDAGLDTSKLTIQCNNVLQADGSNALTYGSDITLTLNYAFTYTKTNYITLTNTNQTQQTDIIPASISTTTKD